MVKIKTDKLKKNILFLALTPMILSANITDIESLYKAKKYEQVIEKSKKRYTEYNNVKLHLIWGQSAEAVGKHEMAMSAYERVLMLDPDNVEMRVHLANYYITLERKDLAAEMSRSTENYQLTPTQRSSMNALYSDDKKHFTASASFMAGYDSNINVSTEDIAIISTNGPIHTNFSRFQANFSYRKDLEKYDNWYTKSDTSIFYQNNASAHLYDFFSGNVNAGIGYKTNDYDIFVPINYERMYYLERDFMQSVSIVPRVNFALNPNYIVNLNLKYSDRNYISDLDKKRDDTVKSVGAGLYYIFDKNFAYVSTKYEDYVSQYKDSTLYTDKTTTHINVGINYHLEDLFIARVDFHYKEAKYNDFVVNGTEKRKDHYTQIVYSASRMITSEWELSLKYSQNENKSNYDVVTYDKNVVMLGLKYNF